MSDKLHFDLVSPESLLVSLQVDSVVVPGSEGDFGVLPAHSPLVSVIRPGILSVMGEGQVTDYFVRGGFADVTADCLTVLAEHAVALQDFNSEARLAEIETAKHALEHATSDQERLNAQMVIDVVEAL